MPGPVSLSAVTALAVAGAGLGLYLGKTAIAEINPAYFDTSHSPASFHADLTANPPGLEGVPLAQPAAATDAGLGSGCVRCPTYSAGYAPVTEVVVQTYSRPATTTRDPEIVLAEIDREIALSLARREATENIERYAHFPVSAEEEREATLVPASAEAPAAVPESSEAAPPKAERPGDSLPGV